MTRSRSKSPHPNSPRKSAKSPQTYVPNPGSVAPPEAKNLDIIKGDHGIPAPKTAEIQDFIWSMTDEPHASRRKAMIKENPEISALMGHEWRTKYIVAVLWVTQLSLAVYLRDDALYGGTLKFWAIVYLFGSVLTSATFLAIHEISHNLAFRKFEHNKLFGIFANLPMLIPFFIFFKNYHNEHHKYQGVDGVDTDLPTAWEAKHMSSTAGKLFYMFNQTWFYAFRPVFTRAQPFTKWHALNTCVQMTFNVGIWYVYGWGPIFYLLACDHLAGSWHPIASHFIAEHFVFAGEVETASYYGWMNWLTWNVGYHNEHHDFPTVAWSNLPKLRTVGDSYYSRLPYHKSWVGALVQFLFDPTVSFYNRVKRKEKADRVAETAEAKKVK